MPFENAPFHKYKPEKNQILINQALRKSKCKKLTVLNTQNIVDIELLQKTKISAMKKVFTDL